MNHLHLRYYNLPFGNIRFVQYFFVRQFIVIVEQHQHDHLVSGHLDDVLSGPVVLRTAAHARRGRAGALVVLFPRAVEHGIEIGVS